MSKLQKPMFLTITPNSKVAVSEKLADVSDQARMTDWLADAFHALVNNTFRTCGLECEGSLSESTWSVVSEFANDVMVMIARQVDVEKDRRYATKTKEALRKSKELQLAEALETVERLKKELNVE